MENTLYKLPEKKVRIQFGIKFFHKWVLLIIVGLAFAACGKDDDNGGARSNAAPMIENQSFNIAEDAQKSTEVGTVSATDADGDDLTFSIADGNTENAFAINTSTGIITVAGSLDFEAARTYTLTVNVSDGTASNAASITINVEDVNETPVIAVNQTFTVRENAANNTAVGEVKAADEENDDLMFSITSGNTGNVFAINTSTGVITVAGTLDYETTRTYTLAVSVTDGTLSSTADITVNVANVNDNMPVITAQSSISIGENTPNNTTVGTMQAADADGDDLTFAIASGNDGDAFAIDPMTGVITVVGTLDFETTRTYTLTLIVSDGIASIVTEITISITDENDKPTIFAQGFSVAEDAGTNTAVGTVQANDLEDDDLTFSISDGNTDNAFAIDPMTGVITVAGTLDYETTRTYILAISVSDGNLPSMADITINITNVNDNAPVITDQTFSIPENAPSNTAVGTVRAADVDSDNLTFSIASGNNGDAFQIAAGTGAITVQTTAALDYETMETYVLSVRVSDGEMASTAAITINITNLIDRPVRDANKDINLAAGNGSPYGIWSDKTTMWVCDFTQRKIYAYRLADGTRDAGKDINLAAGNTTANGVWSDGTTMYVSNFVGTGSKIYAYKLADGRRDAGKDINLAAGNGSPRNIWSDGTTMYVVDSSQKVYAYKLADGTHDADKDINLASHNLSPSGLWSDGTTMWVSGLFFSIKIHAYKLSTKTRDVRRDIDIIQSAGNDRPWGIWSDGTTMWVTDDVDNKIYAYRLPK
ncbi:MAG: cadherin repeat domain-containing protein [Ekhidna sp.]|nr:cadherin repeat domain-containing protein [Ekhidna sp.]